MSLPHIPDAPADCTATPSVKPAMEKPLLQELKPHLAICLFLLAATVAVYAGTLHHSFLTNWDDAEYVVNNPAVRGFSWPHLKQAFTTFYVGNYAPFQIVSYMVDYTLWGLNPAGFHFSNLLLHLLNGLLYYYLVFRLTGGRFWAGCAAFIFLLHPVQVESVAWVSERKNLLAMSLFLGSFLSYLSYRQQRAAGTLGWYLLSCVLFLLALLTKAVVVIMPVVLLLFDFCFLEKERRKGWLVNKIPFAALSAAVALVTLKSQSSVVSEGAALFASSNPLGKLYTMLTVLARYLGLLFWPTDLSTLYMPPVKFRIDAAVGCSALLAAVLVAVGILLWRRRRLFFWYALFFLGLLPVSQIVPIVTLMNDRYLYFPLLGAAAFLAGLLGSLFVSEKPALKAVAAGLLCLALIPLPLISWQRAAVWAGDLTMWQDVTVKVPQSSQAWWGLGMSQYEAGKKEDALLSYQRALAIDPNYQFALNNIGSLYTELGRPAEGRPYLVRAVQLFPDYFNAHCNLGQSYYKSGQLEQAAASFREALALRPDSPAVLASLGDLSLDLHKLPEANDYYRKAVAIAGPNPDVEYKLACLEALSGHPSEALRHLQQALSMGFAEPRMMASDRRLDSLRGLPQFQELLKGL